jgi:GNAT superfamily N-acetyltransferase
MNRALKKTMALKIIPFESKHAVDFRDLNIAWLEKYFFVEAKDKILLDDCENSILGIGGYIFMAEYENSIVGCFSLIPYKEDNYELGKMAVDPNYQGLKIGQQLLSYAIEFAKKNKWKAITLYSSTKLPTALHVYRKYGFKDLELEKDLPYARSDVKMELSLGDS